MGEYEAHVVDRLISLSSEVDGPFIDVGAADGYFAIGMARLEKFEQVIAFEKSAEGRQALSRAVALNDCEGMVDIACELTQFEVDERLGADERALVLIDIEGSEYDLLTSGMLAALRSSYVLVELHPFEIENGIAREQRLIERAHDHFEIEFFIRESYGPNKFSELAAFDDDERLLALSEGRASNMRWMLMSPK
ncbi:hypothetical protein S4A8_10446 [Salinisphaera sp. S4-8]|uniref:hypothetical protein n=1 Tax=Salinisphaera sp. S4-8 TaxID=633357 RepID=UPI0033401FA7